MIKIIKRIVDYAIPKRLKKRWLAEGKRIAFLGGKFYCPCCGNRVIAFLPFGLKTRLNALCPVCSSLERHRLIWLYLIKRKGFLASPGRLLHVAPEPVFYKALSKMQTIEYFPVAKFGDGIEDEYPRGTMNVDITNASFQSNYFDFIICSHVLEHIPDDRAAIRELYRMLKPEGWAILQVPLDATTTATKEDPLVTSPEERERLYGQKDHVRLYGLDYKDRLEHAGFSVQVDSMSDEYSHEELFFLGINSRESVYFCTKGRTDQTHGR